MSATSKLPYIALRFQRSGSSDIQLTRAYFLQTPDGRCWAIPEGSEIPLTPQTVGAILLDPSLLEERPTPDGKKNYLYRAAIQLPPISPDMPGAIQGRFQ
jgi:hypothetical protein